MLTSGGFGTAAKKIAPIALGKMNAQDFNMLLGMLNGEKNKRLRALLRMWRDQNPCDGSKINPPFPYPKEMFDELCSKGQGDAKIDVINRYTPAGRMLLIDFINHKKSGFHPNDQAGCVDHWRSKPEYMKATKGQFRSQALKIAKDVKQYMPDDVELAKMFEESRAACKQKAKLRSSKKKV